MRSLRTDIHDLRGSNWPTPIGRDGKDGQSIGETPENFLLGRAVGPSQQEGALNPDWVEQLLGFPEGWTDIERDEVNRQQFHRRMFPAGKGVVQYCWESPRLTKRKEYRRKRLKAIGNAVVPLQVLGFLEYAATRLQGAAG